jgi:alkanesulfonate monooxygenase SsuD/methylene tetrahydromethanopterin reductase-like flavin-dependent oxidoreductase (luciferase family)
MGVPEHLMMTREESKEMGSRWVHSLSAAGFVLGATTRIKLHVLVCVPYHNPIELAKSFSTLDYMSGGRAIIQALVGYKRSEFDVLRVPYELRGELMDEYMDAMIELWSNPEPAYHGTHVAFDDMVFDPRPVQQPFPVWVGARTNAALRRIARIGDAWMSYATPRVLIPEKIEYIKSQPAFQARPRPLDVFAYFFEGKRDPYTHEVIEQAQATTDKDKLLEEVQKLADIGVTMTDASAVLGTGVFQNDLPGSPPPSRSADDWIERLQWFAEEIRPEASRITPDVR